MKLQGGTLTCLVLATLSAEGQTAEQVVKRVQKKRPDAPDRSIRQLLSYLSRQHCAQSARMGGRRTRLYTLTPTGEDALDTMTGNHTSRVLRLLQTFRSLTSRQLACAMDENFESLCATMGDLRRAGDVRKVPSTPRQQALSRRRNVTAWMLTEAA